MHRAKPGKDTARVSHAHHRLNPGERRRARRASKPELDVDSTPHRAPSRRSATHLRSWPNSGTGRYTRVGQAFKPDWAVSLERLAYISHVSFYFNPRPPCSGGLPPLEAALAKPRESSMASVEAVRYAYELVGGEPEEQEARIQIVNWIKLAQRQSKRAKWNDRTPIPPLVFVE